MNNMQYGGELYKQNTIRCVYSKKGPVRVQFVILLFALGSASVSQIPFDTTDTRLIMWLSPDKGLYNSAGTPAIYGEDVYEWHDISGSGYIFKNDVNSNRPSLVSDGGNNYLDFVPGDFLQNIDVQTELNGLDAFSIFIVIKSDVIGTDRGFLESENPDGNDDNICLRYDAAGANTGRVNCLKTGMVGNSPNHQVESQSNLQTTERQILTLRWKRNERLYLFVDGEISDSSNLAFVNVISNINKIVIGKGPKDGPLAGNGGWDGKIGDVIFFNKKLSNDTIASIIDMLPISLNYFNAYQDNEKVNIIWETSSELNNDFFTIERSTDAKCFVPIGKVNGNGTTNMINYYSWSDYYPLNGIAYYRLRQTDYNAVSKVFNVVPVNYIPLKNAKINIKTDSKKIEIEGKDFESEAEISLCSFSGKQLLYRTVDFNYENLIISTSEFRSGIYYLQCTSSNELFMKKILIP